jgi:hypothetical protein
MVTNAVSKENVYKMKSLSKEGIIKVGLFFYFFPNIDEGFFFFKDLFEISILLYHVLQRIYYFRETWNELAYNINLSKETLH